MTKTDTPAGIATTDEITLDELQLAARNHGMPLEGLRYDVTPVGLHYLLIHFDIPECDADSWTLDIGGLVDEPLTLSLADIKARPAVTRRVTMECAGNGRARLLPRPLSQPWLSEAVGTAEWTGTPLAPILAEAAPKVEAVDVVFEGADHGIQGGIEQDYERALSVADASREEVMLVYEVNGGPLPPQHGYPLRLVVPGWYGMTSVKWLRKVTFVGERFDGYQMQAYRLRTDADDPGEAVSRIQPRALMIPPGFPEFFSRTRHIDAGPTRLEGRAWSGWGTITGVEVSTDGGRNWRVAALEQSADEVAWASWIFDWDAIPGEYTLLCRASDSSGRAQPLEQPWNHAGLSNNAAQQVQISVR